MMTCGQALFSLFSLVYSADDTGISYKFDSTWAPFPAIAEMMGNQDCQTIEFFWSLFLSQFSSNISQNELTRRNSKNVIRTEYQFKKYRRAPSSCLNFDRRRTRRRGGGGGGGGGGARRRQRWLRRRNESKGKPIRSCSSLFPSTCACQHHSGRPSALEEQPLLAHVAPMKISFDAKIGGADPETHLNTFALSNLKLAGNAKWKDFANRTPPIFASPPSIIITESS
jgi:hypothetical protein